MSTKTITTHYKETWQAKLGSGGVDGISGAPIEGVRLGWCKHDGRYYKPVEVPPYVAEFLGLRIVPADYMWPFYIEESFGSVEQVMVRAYSDSPGNYTIVDEGEGIVEFEVDYTNTTEVPIIVEVNFDTAYSVCGWGYPEKNHLGGDTNTVYFDVGEHNGGWYMSGTIDCDTHGWTERLTEDDGPYNTEEEAILGGLNAAFDWFILATDVAPQFMSVSQEAKLCKILADNGLTELFNRPEEGE